MPEHAISLAALLANTRDSVGTALSAGSSASGRHIFFDAATKAAGTAVDDAFREACNVDLVGLLVLGWSKASELGRYADNHEYPAAKIVRVVLAKHEMKLIIDPQLKLQSLPLLNWPLKLIVALEAVVNAATLVIRAGLIEGIDLGTVELSGELRWGETKVPLPLRTHELVMPGKFKIDPPVAIPRPSLIRRTGANV